MLQEILGRYAVSIDFDSLPDDARHHARRVVLDWFAATIPGGVLMPATGVAQALVEEVGHGDARLIPSGRDASMRSAALINGTAAHTIEFDDIFRDGIYHPGAPTIAAALAAAQVSGADGRRFIAGVVAGFEVGNRIARAMGTPHYAMWHMTATCGCMGAAAAVANILGLTALQASHAIGNATTMAGGLQQAFRSDAMTKPLHGGLAAQSGCTAALIAKTGVTAAAHMLEGDVGFGAAAGKDVDWDSVTADLEDHFTITEMTQKNHACCGHNFAAVDAVIALRNDNGLKASDVKTIHCGVYGKAVEIVGNPNPKTSYEAKFSLPYCAAAGLRDGRVRMRAFEPDILHDAEIRDIMTRVHVVKDDWADEGFPGRRSAIVHIETVDGITLTHKAMCRKGDPENPLTDDELNEKYRELVTPVVGNAVAENLLGILWCIDAVSDLTSLPLGQRV
jgi:2-methylcitrate dehydratase PrpD